MKNIILSLLLVATVAYSAGWDERVKQYAGKYVSCADDAILFTADNGITRIEKWDTVKIGKEQPTIAMLISQDTAIASNKAAAAAAAAAKLLARKQYENAYFLLVKSTLTLADDPRKDEVPIPKLGFDELDAILAPRLDCGTNAIEKAARKLVDGGFKLNMQLLRYDINWWDTAVWHGDL